MSQLAYVLQDLQHIVSRMREMSLPGENLMLASRGSESVERPAYDQGKAIFERLLMDRMRIAYSMKIDAMPDPRKCSYKEIGKRFGVSAGRTTQVMKTFLRIEKRWRDKNFIFPSNKFFEHKAVQESFKQYETDAT